MAGRKLPSSILDWRWVGRVGRSRWDGAWVAVAWLAKPWLQIVTLPPGGREAVAIKETVYALRIQRRPSMQVSQLLLQQVILTTCKAWLVHTQRTCSPGLTSVLMCDQVSAA